MKPSFVPSILRPCMAILLSCYLLKVCSAAPVDDAVAFARNANEFSIANAQALLEVLRTGDLEASKQAYVKLRPEYEQIEHHFEVFGDTDADIDARPYGFPYGEAYDSNEIATPGAIFKGSHRIEAILYRDGNVSAAIPWTEQLISDFMTLETKLEDATQYSAPQIFNGMIELAFEVAKKKFSSEEETWSDLSVLIFYHNLKGIIEFVKPWQAELATVNQTLADQLEADLNAANTTLAALIETGPDGTVTYTPYSDISVETRAAIQKDFYQVALDLVEVAAALGIEIPAAEEEEEACNPEVSTASYDFDSPEIMQGLDYFRALMPYAINASAEFTSAVDSGDLEAAKQAYIATRPIYEQIEVLAVSFPDVDEALDAREYAYGQGELDEEWRGYHRLERLIFRDGNVGEETLAYARGVEESLQQLDAALNDPSLFSGTLSFEGILGLATEVPAKKISSEEETSSDLSLLIFYNNWKGILSQVAPFCPKAQEYCDELNAAINEAVACLDLQINDTIGAVSASDVTPESINNLLTADYKAYSDATMEQRRCIVEQGYAVRDSIAKIANALQLVDDCSPYYAESFLTYPEGMLPMNLVASSEAP